MKITLIQNTQLRAVLWMVLNCFMAASVLALVKYSSPNFHLGILLSGYHLTATVLTILVLLYFRSGIKTKVLHLHFIRSVCSIVAYFLYFYALSVTSLPNVMALGYTDAILTCLFSYLFLKESLEKAEIINLALSFVGALLIIRPDAHIFNSGAILAGISAILWAISNVVIKVIGKTDKEYVQLFYSNFFMFLLSFGVAACQTDMMSFTEAFYNYPEIILLLAFLTSIQAYALFKSLTLAPAGVIMPFFIISIVFVHLYGYIFFGEVQNSTELTGTFLIIISGLFQIISLAKK